MTLTRTRSRFVLECVSLLTPLLVAVSASAQEAVLELDPAQTQINFTLSDVLHTVHGSFKLKRGTIRFDPATGKAGGLVIVDATSGESGSNSRDRKMHRDILESQKYTEITFAPEQVHGHVAMEGDSHADIQGTFNVHGVSHEITMKARVQLAGDRLTADANFPIPYVNWGLKNPSTFILRVSDTVEINLYAVGRVAFQAPH